MSTAPATGSENSAAPDGVACAATNLSVAYGTDPVLRSVNLTVPQGVVMGVVGPNGAGKSTLIKAMLGLVPTLTGSATFFGRPLSEVRSRVGYMPQSAALDWDFPTTVFDVVLMGTYGRLGWFRRPGSSERARAAAALEQVGISGLAKRQIGELSGGQQQRVLLARMLAQDPELCIMDEPFQGIDAKSQRAILAVLHELRAAHRTVLIVHHDLPTVREYCDEVTLLNRSVVASGPVTEVFTNDNIRAAYELPDGADDLIGFIP